MNGPNPRTEVKLLEGIDHAFADSASRALVRAQTRPWVASFFPAMECAAEDRHQASGIALRATCRCLIPVFDSLCFAIVVARLEDTLGLEPFSAATSALTLMELDGVVRRMVLCPPGVTVERLAYIAGSASADTIISDLPAPEHQIPGVMDWI